uniref:PIR2-like helical domain-containing protein n=1 Tax=Oryza glaberrima TaxID=4538 RepID=I1Q1E5_ORYGL
MARNRRVILGLMYGYYEEALDALSLDRVCFGFADPVTNIIANTLRVVPSELPDSNGAMIPKRETTMASRSRVARASGEMVLSKIVAGGDVPSPPEAHTVAERSLEGLITLTSYYHYLPT